MIGSSRRPLIALAVVAVVGFILLLALVQLAGRDARLSAAVPSRSAGACYKSSDDGSPAICHRAANETSCNLFGALYKGIYFDPGRPCRPDIDLSPSSSPVSSRIPRPAPLCFGSFALAASVPYTENEDGTADIAAKAACSESLREQEFAILASDDWFCPALDGCGPYGRPTRITYDGEAPDGDGNVVNCSGLLYCGPDPVSSSTANPTQTPTPTQ